MPAARLERRINGPQRICGVASKRTVATRCFDRLESPHRPLRDVSPTHVTSAQPRVFFLHSRVSVPGSRRTVVTQVGSVARARIGIDIGGTFTDLILVETATGAMTVGKSLTTPADPSDAVERRAPRRSTARRRAGVCRRQRHPRHHPGHQRLIERKGATTALLTTKGFRDAVEIGREHRYDLYDLFLEMPKPLVPRYLRLEVDERVLADGTIVQRARRRGGRAARRASFAAKRHRGDRGLAAARLPQPDPRAAGRARSLRERRAGHAASRSPPTWCRRSASTSARRTTVATSTSRRSSIGTCASWSASCATARAFAGAVCSSCSRSGGIAHRRDGRAVPDPPARVRAGRRRARGRALRHARSASATCCRSTWAAPPPSSA